MINNDQANGLSRRLFFWWADHTSVQAVAIVVMTVLAIVGYVRPSLVRDLFVTPAAEGSSSDSRPNQRPRTFARNAPPADVQPFQVAGGDCIVVATTDDFFTPANLEAIRAVVADLEALPQVSRVLWIDSIPGLNLFGLPEAILPRSNASPRQMEMGRERALKNPLAVGQLISADGRTLLLHLTIDWFYVTSDEACTTDLRTTAEAATERVPGATLEFRVTGPAPLHLMMADNHVRDSLRYQVVGYSIMIVAALVLFRGLAAVLIVALAPAMGVFWTMGIIHLFDLQDNPFNDVIVPILISLVGLTDAVHLMVEIRNQRAAGREPRDATRTGVARVGMACALTSLTTAIGFASLLNAHHEVVRTFGWSCVLGVVLTFISVMAVVPLGCCSPLGKRLHVGIGRSPIDAQMKKIGPLVAWTLRHDRLVAWLAILVTALLAAFCTRLQPDEKRYSGLSDTGEAAQALRHLDQTLGGLEFGHVRIEWNDSAQEGELLNVLNEVDRVLDDEPLIGNPLGLHDLLDALPGEGPADERMTLLELLPPPLKRAFYVPENQTATIQFRVQDVGIAQYGPVFSRVESRLQEVVQRHPDYSVGLDGSAVWRWKNVYQIITDLATSLGTASIVIWIVLTIAYRSIRIGLISVVPNLFPLVATGAMLLLAGQYLELVVVCVFTICVGIAVDDTIHFLTRYMEESAAGHEHRETIQRAFTGVGSALLMTTLVLVTGMSTAVFGDARDARLFGGMGAITLSAALFADVLFLPALLNQFARPKRRPAERNEV